MSKPEIVTVIMAGVPINCTVDIGTEITVIRPDEVPDFILQDNNHEYKIIVLTGAFGNCVEAKLATLPYTLGDTLAKVNLVCAVTDQLNVGVDCLLTKDDFDRLLDDMREKASAVLLVNADNKQLTDVCGQN